MVPADILGEQVAFLQDNMTRSRSTRWRASRSASTCRPGDPDGRGGRPGGEGADRGASSYKPAKLSNGVKTLVPPFIETGERIVVKTEDGSYVERAKG